MRLLLLLLPLLPFMAKADMDKICHVNGSSLKDAGVFISENCERNNILFLYNAPHLYQVRLISQYCRFDRNVERDETKFTCVLYNNTPRAEIREILQLYIDPNIVEELEVEEIIDP